MKSVGKSFYLSLIFFIILLAGIFVSSFIYQSTIEDWNVFADGGTGTPENPYQISSEENLIEMMENINSGIGKTAHYKLMQSIELTGKWTPIGSEENPFSGKFDGNGKTISGIELEYNSTSKTVYLGLFGKIENATITALKVNVKIELDGGGEILPRVEAGAITGRAHSSDIRNCQIEFEIESIDEGGYRGKIFTGGVVGYADGLSISKCGVRTKINVTQTGSDSVDSCFGGVAGYMNNGGMSLVYVAPSETLVADLNEVSGSITALEKSKADVIITNNNTIAGAKIYFGGLIGHANGNSLSIISNVYSSLYYTGTPTKVHAGGVVGRISENLTYRPKSIIYSKYLAVPNASVSTFSSSVGNAIEIAYSPSETNTSISAMPTSAFYKSENWDETIYWNFDDDWKEESIMSGYFFPNLQNFASYKIKLSPSYAVEIVDGQYRTGYIKLSFIGGEGTEISVPAGEIVEIKAEFYEDDNPFRKFKHYYTFTNWMIGDNVIAKATINSSNGYEVSASSDGGSSILSFTSSATTEGTYGVDITGRDVAVKVNFVVEGHETFDGTFGSINYFKAGNIIENKTKSFIIEGIKYKGAVATKLEARDLPSSEYVFAQKWQDDNLLSNVILTRSMLFELDNNSNSSSSKLFPRVVYDEEEKRLVASITCYFSNNTAILMVNVSDGGEVSIDGGEFFSEEHEQDIIKNKKVSVEAVAKEGYKFVGWEIDNKIVGTSILYEVSISENQSITAKFQAINATPGTGFPMWAITLIIISASVIVGTIIFIIIKVRKNSLRGYRKNYKY